jgi:hypothetical protein
VTIEPRTDAWSAVVEACALTVASDRVLTMPGYVTVAAGAVTGRGPFDAEVLCEDGILVAVSVEEEDGEYSLPPAS